jgi:AraC-like DNA-binding protein
MIPFIRFPLTAMPEIVQCGLCLHGGRAVETHRQLGLWSLHFYHYDGTLEFQGSNCHFRAGWVSLLPPGESVTWHFPPHAVHHYAHFRSNGSRRTGVRVPILARTAIETEIDAMVGFHQTNPPRANVRLWDILHTYADRAPEPAIPGKLHPHLQIALSIIRNEPATSHSTSGIAARIGVSRNHLAALFHAEFGTGLREFVTRDRVARALDLLETTTLPVKAVAIECGLPDLQHFNKLVRAATGAAPTIYRARRQQRE